MRVFNKLLHLINPNLSLLKRGGGGGVGLFGPNTNITAKAAARGEVCGDLSARLRPISVLRFWISEGLTEAES